MKAKTRQELLQFINEVSFVTNDTQLFLDTHPDNEEALEHFRKYSRMRNEALKEYERRYGPLTVDVAVESDKNVWNWAEEPWPWMGGMC